MRQIVLDTETTGLEASAGHRLIEIGCVELINRRLTGNTFHQYINPEREIDAGAQKVHGLSREFLADKPVFADIVTAFLAFITDAELIIHNAAFDVGFINAELQKYATAWQQVSDHCQIVDTLNLAREKFPGQKNNLDALCKRYDIDNSHRTLHGALLDAEILAEVYLAMTGGQFNLAFDEASLADTPKEIAPTESRATQQSQADGLIILSASAEELKAHNARLESLQQASAGNCLWQQLQEP